jgi:hypothetical protein
VEASGGFRPTGRNSGEAAEAQTRAVRAGARGEARGGVWTGPSRLRCHFNGTGVHVAPGGAVDPTGGPWRGKQRPTVGPRGSDFLN